MYFYPCNFDMLICTWVYSIIMQVRPRMHINASRYTIKRRRCIVVGKIFDSLSVQSGRSLIVSGANNIFVLGCLMLRFNDLFVLGCHSLSYESHDHHPCSFPSTYSFSTKVSLGSYYHGRVVLFKFGHLETTTTTYIASM